MSKYSNLEQSKETHNLAYAMYWDMMTQGPGHVTDGYFGSSAGVLNAQLSILENYYSPSHDPAMVVAACGIAKALRLEEVRS